MHSYEWCWQGSPFSVAWATSTQTFPEPNRPFLPSWTYFPIIFSDGIFWDLWSILGNFWDPNFDLFSIFFLIIFGLHFWIDFLSIWKPPNLESSNFSEEKQCFLQNWRFGFIAKFGSKMFGFAVPNFVKNRRKFGKNVFENKSYLDIDFFDFGLHFGSQVEAPKFYRTRSWGTFFSRWVREAPQRSPPI